MTKDNDAGVIAQAYVNVAKEFDASTRLKSWDSVAIREKYQSPYGFLRNKGFHVCSLC